MRRVDTDTWEVVDRKGMLTGKSDIKVVHLDNHLYVCGDGKTTFER